MFKWGVNLGRLAANMVILYVVANMTSVFNTKCCTSMLKGQSMIRDKLKAIQDRLSIDLIHGSANKARDVEKSSGWSKRAVDATRMLTTYEQTEGSWAPVFFRLRVSKQTLMPYVAEGANGITSRAGNCQEFVGLSLYYLFSLKEISQIDVCTLPDCFDHVFLRVHSDQYSIIFDPWAGQLLTNDSFDNLMPILNQCINSLNLELSEQSDEESRAEVEMLINECEAMLLKKRVEVTTEEIFTADDKDKFQKQFDEYRNRLLKESYPSSKI